MRTFIIATFIFFALAPVAFAASANGTACTSPSQCTGGFCNGRDSEGLGVCASTNQSTTGINTSQTQTTGVNTGVNTTLINPLGSSSCNTSGTCLESFINSILQFVVRLGSIVVILMLVYVGFLFVVARGNPGDITKARTALMWTIIGALILLGAQAISLGIQATVQAVATG